MEIKSRYNDSTKENFGICSAETCGRFCDIVERSITTYGTKLFAIYKKLGINPPKKCIGTIECKKFLQEEAKK